jgi:hypothetical protein
MSGAIDAIKYVRHQCVGMGLWDAKQAVEAYVAEHNCSYMEAAIAIVKAHKQPVSLPNHANQLAELIGRVHTFADQLLAWGYKDIAHQVLTEILIGPVVTDDTYATLQETRADLEQAVREIDELRNALEKQSRDYAHMRATLVEAQEELSKGGLLNALAAIGRGLNEGRT